MGGKTSTSTSEATIPPAVLRRYNQVNARAEKAANRPFKNYQGEFVAPVNQQQMTGTNTINNAANMAQPYYNQAQDYISRGSGTAEAKDLDVARYYNPYQSEVIDSTSKLIDQGNEQAMSGSLGDAIKNGSFGGDRAGIAAAVLAGQQQMSRANTLAGLKQQGYQQAVSTAQQQQGVDLGARQADLARLTQAGQSTAGIGAQAQQGQLAAGESQINAGTLQQQTQQAEDTAKYQQFLQKRGYPFQIAQFLANIAMGTGSLSGSTTTTTQPAPFFSDRRLKHDVKRIGKTYDGQPIYSYKYKGDDQTQLGLMADEVEKKHPEAVGKSLGYKTVDYEKATDGSWRDEKAEGGSVYGANIGSTPYGQSYVPEAYLKVGELMRPDTSGVSKPQSLLDELSSVASLGKQAMSLGDTASQVKGWFSEPEKALGGSVGEVSYLDKPDLPEPESYLSDTLKQQDDDNEGRKALMEAKPAPPPQSGASALGSAAGGIGSLLSGVAGLFALSDRRAKHDIKRIGESDNGMPIYSFKYKGDNQTHIGFMADEVEDDHPEAVRTGDDGLKRVDLGQAHKFARGGDVGRGTLADLSVSRPAYLEGGVIEEELPSLGIVPEGKQYDSVGLVRSLGILPRKEPAFVSEDADKTLGSAPSLDFKETPHRYTPPGFHPSNLDTSTLVRDDPDMAPVKRAKVVEVPALETRTLGDLPKVAAPVVAEEKPLVSVDNPKGNRLAYRKAITDIESSGRYDILGPKTKSGDRAYGRYQVMGNNVPEWTEEALGVRMTPAEFLASPKAQDAVFDHRFGSYVDKYGSPQEAASVWFTGQPIAIGGTRKDVLGTTGNKYVDMFTNNLKRHLGTVEDEVSDGVKTLGNGVKDVASGVKTLGNDVVSGVKTLGDKTGDVLGNATSGIKGMLDKATGGNQDVLLSILSGLGTMAGSNSRYLGSAILQGIGGGAQTYGHLRGQTADLTAKNLENTKALTNAWQQHIALNDEDRDLSLSDFAKQRGYEKFLPKVTDINPNSESRIKLQDEAPDAAAPTREYTGKEMNTAMIDGIPAFNNAGYLTAFIAANAKRAEASPYIKAEVDAARENLARIQASGVTYGADDKPIIPPGVTDVQSDMSQAETNRKTKAAFTEGMPQRAASINSGITNLSHLEDAFRGFDPGAGTAELSSLAALVKRFDPNDTSGIASTLQSSGIDADEIQKAKKYAAVYLSEQLKNMPGGAPASTMEFLADITPDIMMQPEAARAIIVRAKADLLSQQAFLDAVRRENPVNVAEFEAQFYKDHPLENFMQIAEKDTAPLGRPKEVAPPTDDELKAMPPELRKQLGYE